MRLPESKEWIIGAIITSLVALGGIMVALGIKTPQQVMVKTETEVETLRDKVYDHEARISVVETQIADIKGGVEELVGHPLGRKKRR